MKYGCRAHDYGCFTAQELARTLADQGYNAAQLAMPKAIRGIADMNGISPEQLEEIRTAFAEADVEITVENNDYDFKTFEGSGIHSVKDFTVGEVTEEKNGDQMYFTGTITNDSDEDLGGVIATIVFKKDGNIVGGVTGQVGGIVAGDTTTFNIAAKSGFSDYDSYDVYVTQEPA